MTFIKSVKKFYILIFLNKIQLILRDYLRPIFQILVMRKKLVGIVAGSADDDHEKAIKVLG